MMKMNLRLKHSRANRPHDHVVVLDRMNLHNQQVWRGISGYIPMPPTDSDNGTTKAEELIIMRQRRRAADAAAPVMTDGRLVAAADFMELRCVTVERFTDIARAVFKRLKLKFHWDQFPRNFLADLLATSPTSP